MTKKAKGDLLRRELTLVLPVPMKSKEVEKAKDELVALTEAYNVLLGERSAALKEFRDRVKQAHKNLQDCLESITVGSKQEVECEEMKDFKKNTITIKRLDTQEVVEKREMDEADRQTNLDEHEVSDPNPKEETNLAG